jgi:protein CpxP
MKKLLLIILLCLTISGISQEKKNQFRTERVAFTSQQKAELQVKKMTLELELSAKQQQEISELLLNYQIKRQEMRMKLQSIRADNKKLTTNEKFVLKSDALDEKIAVKGEMKKILKADQFAKWEKRTKKKKMKIENQQMKRKN